MNYRTAIVSNLAEIGERAWNALLAQQSTPPLTQKPAPDPVPAAAPEHAAAHQSDVTPFLSYAFLHALHASGAASAHTGWQVHYLALYDGATLAAAMPLYLKSHSYGEYVFDWAWAAAYAEHGLDYYPKLLSAIPFTPVAGARLLAVDERARTALIEALQLQQRRTRVSSCHILYPPEQQARQLQQAGFMLRSAVQFHWTNAGYRDFDEFLATLEQKKRKNIRAERRKVAEAGVTFRRIAGTQASAADWAFFNRCYARTYAEHRSSPYLNLDFFERIGRTMPENILLVVAERGGTPIASSLLIHNEHTLFGRYWGALEYVPCLHFETAYYQPLEFCIERKLSYFEGGAQGEHKMARGFLPQKTWSAHWLAHPAFADAVERFLQRERGGIEAYIDELDERNPFRDSASQAAP